MKAFIRKLLRESLFSNEVLFHGTPEKHNFNNSGQVYDGTFFSPNFNEARSYGQFVYKVRLKPNLNIFDTTNINDVEKLLSAFGELYDDYYNEDEDNYYITKPEQIVNNSDNWNPIERTEGVLDWIHSQYDGVLVTEGGVENLLLFNPVLDKINTITEVQ